jgi:hypothetical protein
MSERSVWFTDRYGREIEHDVTVERLGALLETIAESDGDDEHASISVSDSDAWNLEYYRRSVLFQSLEGGEVGLLRDLVADERLAVGAEFLAGDFDALHARPWAA